MSAAAAAVGTFDGVHRGHIAVLDTLKELASEKGLEPMAFTFDRHPLSLIAPSRAPKAITTLHKERGAPAQNASHSRSDALRRGASIHNSTLMDENS